MRTAVKNYGPALACTMTLLLCYLATRPFAEIGMDDDWSYIKTAQALAETGHMAYNGWASPMLGWHACFGAMLIKLLGFSFTAVRLATLFEAMATAFLLERACVRASLNAWNATLVTLALVLSPLYLPLAFTFMTDIAGVLAIVACFYMCLRAVEAESERAAAAWIVCAALLNALGGTARQIAWFGVLVMVPSTLWLLRKRRRVLVAGSLACIAGAAFVAVATQWLSRQPYSLPVSAIPDKIDWNSLQLLRMLELCSAGALTLMALPVLLMFGRCLFWLRRSMAAVFAASFVGLGFLWIFLVHTGRASWWNPPFFDDSIGLSTFARVSAMVVQAVHFPIFNDGFRSLLTGAIVLGIFSLGACALGEAHDFPARQQAAHSISWRKLGIVLGPFSAAYVVCLALNELRNGSIFNRYLLPLLCVLLLVLARYYQERVKAKLPWLCALAIGAYGTFSLAATHDEFAVHRAYVTAIREIESSGAPATAILGPLEFSGWTQIEKAGYVNDSHIRVPANAYVPPPVRLFPASCDRYATDLPDATSVSFLDSWSAHFLDWTPAIKPVYAIFLNPEACGGQIAFPPVMYRTWTAPHNNWVYAVKLPANFPQ